MNTLFKYMPPVNNFDIGDGLNVAGHRWIRRRDGGENLFDAGEPSSRKQWNVKIDHIFNQNHKISGAWSFEKDYASDAFMAWPGTWEGKDYNQPQVLTVNFVSTLSPRLVTVPEKWQRIGIPSSTRVWAGELPRRPAHRNPRF